MTKSLIYFKKFSFEYVTFHLFGFVLSSLVETPHFFIKTAASLGMLRDRFQNDFQFLEGQSNALESCFKQG